MFTYLLIIKAQANVNPNRPRMNMVCKILERTVKANILQYLKTDSIISDAHDGLELRRSSLTDQIVTEELITGQGEPVDVRCWRFSKAYHFVCNCRLAKNMIARGNHLKIAR